MKIGLVCPYTINGGGGVQEVVLALQSGLTKRGHEVKIITPLPRGYNGPTDDHILFVGTSADIKSPLHTTAQLSVSLNLEEINTLLLKEKFDILHFHEPWVPIMSRQLLNRSSCINVATFHAKLPETPMSKAFERVVTPYTKSVVKQLDVLTAVSTAAAEYVQALTTKKITIIPNGIDLNKYQRQSHHKTKTKQILYIGRLEKRKGLKYLLLAFSKLNQNHKDLRLVVAGVGPDADKLKALAKKENINNIKFLGYVSETSKIKLLSQADLFCSPAIYGESFGIVLLEAMASGIVTVAGNNPGYSTVLKDTGSLSLVNPTDQVEFARRLELLLYDDKVRAIWLDWALSYIKQFNYEKVIASYEQLYMQALEHKK